MDEIIITLVKKLSSDDHLDLIVDKNTFNTAMSIYNGFLNGNEFVSLPETFSKFNSYRKIFKKEDTFYSDITEIYLRLEKNVTGEDIFLISIIYLVTREKNMNKYPLLIFYAMNENFIYEGKRYLYFIFDDKTIKSNEIKRVKIINGKRLSDFKTEDILLLREILNSMNEREVKFFSLSGDLFAEILKMLPEQYYFDDTLSILNFDILVDGDFGKLMSGFIKHKFLKIINE